MLLTFVTAKGILGHVHGAETITWNEIMTN